MTLNTVEHEAEQWAQVRRRRAQGKHCKREPPSRQRLAAEARGAILGQMKGTNCDPTPTCY